MTIKEIIQDIRERGWEWGEDKILQIRRFYNPNGNLTDKVDHLDLYDLINLLQIYYNKGKEDISRHPLTTTNLNPKT